MIQKTVKRNGQTYTLLWEGYDRDTKLCLDGVYAEKVYFHPKNNIFYAPFETKDGAYWMFVYNQKLYFTKAIHGTSEDNFEKDVVGHAYPLFFSILYLLFAILVPTVIAATLTILLVPKQDTNTYVFLASCAVFDYLIFNLSPVASKKVRRKLSLFSMVGILLIWAIFLLNYWAI